MKRAPSILTTLLFLVSFASLPSQLLAQKFEGTVEFTITRGETIIPVTYMMKGDNVRVETEGRPGMKAVILMDTRENKTTMVMDAMKMYMEMPVPVRKDSGTSKYTFKKTGKTQKLLGYDCDEYVFTDGKTEASVWGTKALGAFAHYGMGGRPGSNADGWESAIGTDGGFPLLAVIKTEDGNESTFKATKIEKKSLDEALFKIPEGYQKMDASMMRRPR